MKPCSFCQQPSTTRHESIADCLTAALDLNRQLRAANAEKDQLLHALALGRPAPSSPQFEGALRHEH